MDFVGIILSTLAVLIILSVHEFSHGYAAYKLGDNTAKYMGRLTLNPLKHLDLFGAICMVFFHFGWAKPVPVNLRNFKKPKRDFAIVALAGPLSNLIMAFISTFLYLFIFAIFWDVRFPNEFTLNLVKYTSLFLYYFFTINVGLAIFNLIPIPPLDGSRILGAVLPTKAYINYLKHERTIYFILIGWLLLGDILSGLLLRIPLVSAVPLLRVFATALSLSDMLSYAISFVSELMLDFWRLIPFLNV